MRTLLHALTAGAVLLLTGCRDAFVAPATATRGHLVDARTNGTPGGGGAPEFFWLPPTVPAAAAFSGTFDPARALTVRVVCVNAATPGCPTLAVLDANSPGTGKLVVDAAKQLYKTVWLAPSTLQLGSGLYRVDVLDGADVVGQGALTIVVTTREAAAVPSSEIAVIRGKSLTLAFRLEVSVAEADQLPGTDDDPAVAAVALLRAPDDGRNFTTGHPDLPGLPTSVNDAVVHVAPTATLAMINAALRTVGARIIGGSPGVPGSVPAVLVLRFTTTTHAALAERLTLLRAQPGILAAMADVHLSTTALPATGAGTADDWEWVSQIFGGNAGLKAMRVPSMWNFNEFVQHSGSPTEVGVIDVGFFAHDDLALQSLTNNVSPSEHGTHVAGTIGATFGNGVGVDGVNPFAKINAEAGVTGMAVLATTVATHIEQFPSERVINLSVGYNWYNQSPAVDPGTSTAAQGRAQFDGLTMLYTLQSLAGRGHQLPVITASAGNDSNKNGWGFQYATFLSPLTSAGIYFAAAPILVVEASTAEFARAPFTGINGHVRAPGVDILSTTKGSSYAKNNGTSMAAPHIAGVISYLYSVDPTLPGPTMTANPIRTLLDNAIAQGASPSDVGVNAYQAVLDIDRLRGNDRLLRVILDVDDGSLDGNLRVNANGQPVVSTDLDGNGRTGDGVIDMSDFRVFRDHLLDIEKQLLDLDEPLFLNGVANHPKRDLNRDGVVDGNERRSPRTDFNGDGQLHRTRTARMSGALNGQVLTDLQVLQSRFDDPHYVAADLPGLVNSADVTFNLTPCFQPGQFARIRARVHNTATVVQERFILSNAQVQIFTLPAASVGYDFTVQLLDTDGITVLSTHDEYSPADLGMDTFITTSCPVVAIAPQSPTVVVGTQFQFTAQVTGTANTAVTWSASAGSISSTGLFTAPSTPQDVQVTATSVANTSVTAQTTVTVVPAVVAPAPAIGFQLVSGTFSGKATTPMTYRVRFTSFPGHTVQFTTTAFSNGNGFTGPGPIDQSLLTLTPRGPTVVDDFRVDWFADVTFPVGWQQPNVTWGITISTRACYFLPSGEPLLGANGTPLCSVNQREY